MFFQMFLLWKSSWKDRGGLEVGAASASSSAAGEQRQAGFLAHSSGTHTHTHTLSFRSQINTSVFHRGDAAEDNSCCSWLLSQPPLAQDDMMQQL